MVFYEIISWIFFICLTKKKQNKKICNEVRRFIRQNILNWPLLVFFYVSHVIIINFGTTYHGCRTPCNIRSWCAVPKTRKYFKISFKIKVYKLDKSPKTAFLLDFFGHELVSVALTITRKKSVVTFEYSCNFIIL